ncbi:MAG: polyamine aminopropyltransferase [Chloroflexi bacterium]|nr:polyamine aminopropyltransferase [Chloroflexota bacterium]
MRLKAILTSLVSDRAAVSSYVLLFATFVIAGCAIVYELLISATSSYLLGDTIRQFSMTIGLFLTAMGVGSWLSRWAREDLIQAFCGVEVVLGLAGGLSTPMLYFIYGTAQQEFAVAGVLFILVIGGLIGLELPLVTRVLAEQGPLRTILANALSFDYLGGLVGSLAFPLVLLPQLGLVRTSLFVGFINEAVAATTVLIYRKHLGSWKRLGLLVALATATLLMLIVESSAIDHTLEQRLFRDPIIIAARSPYQHIVVTRWHDDVRLFLDGHLQFSSVDQYRYHEALVIPAIEALSDPHTVLIIGGGDGLAAHEVLKYHSVWSITLVDLDSVVISLFTHQPLLRGLNGDALANPRVHVLNGDGFAFLRAGTARYDLIIADLPDPRSTALQKLYTEEFYAAVSAHLQRDGLFVTQATSPFYTPHAFWCIDRTASAIWPQISSYHVDVPSFGDWGFVLAGNVPVQWKTLSPHVPTRFLTRERLHSLTIFGRDILEVSSQVQPDTLLHPVLLQYYDQDWARFQR